MTTISNETARNFLVNYQNLNGYGELEGRDGAARYMQKVRCATSCRDGAARYMQKVRVRRKNGKCE